MTQEVLIQAIFVLCQGSTINVEGLVKPGLGVQAAKEYRIDCMESYVNCAVGPNGKIMELKEFITKCKGK